MLAGTVLALLATIAVSGIEASYVPTPGKLYIKNNLQLGGDGSCIGSVIVLYGIDIAGSAGLVEITPKEDCSLQFNFTKLAQPQTGTERTVTSALDKVENPRTNTFYNPPITYMVTADFVVDLDGCPRGIQATSEPEIHDTYERELWPAPNYIVKGNDCDAYAGAWWSNDNGNPLDGTHESPHFNLESRVLGPALNPRCDYVQEPNTRLPDRPRCWWYPDGDADEPNWSQGDRVISDRLVPGLTSYEVPT